MSDEQTYRSLLEKFKKTEQELGDAEKTIRRITGRDPQEVSNVVPTVKYRESSSVPGRPYSGRKRPAPYSVRKQSPENSSNEDESAAEDDSPSKKPTLQSTVVAKSRESRTRKATIEEQNANSKVKARNRRMFGALIGTLEKFQHEEKKRQLQECMRAEIEQKVEAATEEEKERIKKEKEFLFASRREKQAQLRCLEKKLERAESYEVYDMNHRRMKNFILTKTKPHIFFTPSTHNSETRRCLRETKVKIEELIVDKKNNLEKDLTEIDDWYTKDHGVPANKENKCPKEECETQDVVESESESLIIEQEDTGLDDEDSKLKNIESLTDQDFEPIYD